MNMTLKFFIVKMVFFAWSQGYADQNTENLDLDAGCSQEEIMLDVDRSGITDTTESSYESLNAIGSVVKKSKKVRILTLEDVDDLFIEYCYHSNYRGILYLFTCFQDPFRVNKINLHGDNAFKALVKSYVFYKERNYCKFEMNRRAIINLLLEKGSDVNQLDFKGRTPLLYACLFGDYYLAYRLLNPQSPETHCVDTNYVLYIDDTYVTPLICACTYGNMEIIDMLLEKGSSYRVPYDTERTAFSFIQNVELQQKYAHLK